MSDIKDTFIEKLKATEWMDEKVVDLAIEKVHKIVQKIGYPTKVCLPLMDVEAILILHRVQTLWIHQVCKIITVLSTSLRLPSSRTQST